MLSQLFPSLNLSCISPSLLLPLSEYCVSSFQLLFDVSILFNLLSNLPSSFWVPLFYLLPHTSMPKFSRSVCLHVLPAARYLSSWSYYIRALWATPSRLGTSLVETLRVQAHCPITGTYFLYYGVLLRNGSAHGFGDCCCIWSWQCGSSRLREWLCVRQV